MNAIPAEVLRACEYFRDGAPAWMAPCMVEAAGKRYGLGGWRYYHWERYKWDGEGEAWHPFAETDWLPQPYAEVPACRIGYAKPGSLLAQREIDGDISHLWLVCPTDGLFDCAFMLYEGVEIILRLPDKPREGIVLPLPSERRIK